MIRKAWRSVLVICFFGITRVVAQEAAPYGDLVDANNRFALKLFDHATTSAPRENILVAPTALFLDFAFLQNGADATARQQLADVFEWKTLSPAQINEQSAALRQALTYSWPSAQQSPQAKQHKETGEQLIMSGSLWINPPLVFRPQFLDVNKKFFGFKTQTTSDKMAAYAINDWLNRQIGVSLTSVMDPHSGDDFVLVDTTWFKGSWIRPFSPSDTHPGDFTLLRGTKKSVPMMSKQAMQPYLKGERFQAIVLDYWNAQMYVFLPDEGSSLAEFEQSLTPDNWSTWIRKFESRPGYLELPKFQSLYRGNTKAVLEEMGVKEMFESFHSLAPAVANPEGAKLTRAISLVQLRVDEKGTEVITTGIVGGVVGGIRAMPPPPPPFRMIVDRPFFFAIADRKTRAILYMGAVVEP